MYEVELKVRADRDAVRRRLVERGAERVGAVVQRDTYYDAPHRNFAETDEALRIRREEELDGAGETTAKVTYKGPLVEAESKTREEFETEVADDEAMAGVLGGLGFEPAAVVEKERERYALDGYAVTLDRVAGLGEFVEVEREATEGEIEAVREGAVGVLRDLGLDPDGGIRTSYLGLLSAENAPE
ncbi:class IV adenylate cyclase [Halegenticoccus soli]|uniref:class IV adenylate cyclase n=1 Tax=Halegenticoccus soli TaxID=1985678 RepID=UPI000C6C9ED9|nr:class IV adenylate cyclase [Halegenticoccus soli]